MAHLGHHQAPVRLGFNHAPALAGVAEPWTIYLQRWSETSTLTVNARNNLRTNTTKTPAGLPNSIDAD
ncbi:hypothetical protein GCM10009578_093830 [Streptomyces rhizosphaericus]